MSAYNEYLDEMNRELAIDEIINERHEIAESMCSNMCRGCQYMSVEMDDGPWPLCVLVDEQCPIPGDEVCPAARIVFESFIPECVRCKNIEALNFDEIYCDNKECIHIDTLENYCEPCEHKKNITYIEKRLYEKGVYITMCKDCGFHSITKIRG